MKELEHEPDWLRERPIPGRYEPWKHLIRCMRGYQAREHNLYAFYKPLLVLAHRFWSMVCACDIPINARIGGGILLTHPNGIVIHPNATVGVNCLIFQQVTIGTGSKPGVPKIGAGVEIGAGAKILGGVRIGRGARVGANAVVVDDIPAGATAVGIPARVIRGVRL